MSGHRSTPSGSLGAFLRLLRGEITAKHYADVVRCQSVALLGGSGNSESLGSPGASRRRSPSTKRPLSRYLLWPLCHVVGHKPGWIPAWVPNPYAKQSWQWGCLRCHDSVKWKAEVKS